MWLEWFNSNHRCHPYAGYYYARSMTSRMNSVSVFPKILFSTKIVRLSETPSCTGWPLASVWKQCFPVFQLCSEGSICQCPWQYHLKEEAYIWMCCMEADVHNNPYFFHVVSKQFCLVIELLRYDSFALSLVYSCYTNNFLISGIKASKKYPVPYHVCLSKTPTVNLPFVGEGRILFIQTLTNFWTL